MQCTTCSGRSKVLESRLLAETNVLRRRRECSKCARRFTTYERVEAPTLLVIKNNGSQESFRYDKLLDGIMRATKNTSMTKLQSEELARKIEKEILSLGKAQIKSHKIGAIVVKHLAITNKVAYLRFVSVYRRLKTLTSFERELESVKNINKMKGKV